jgi:hypothetical protein
VTLLLPSLGRAREKARQAVCLSNFNQINKGVFLFVKESKGKLPGPLTWLQSNTYTTHKSSLAGELAPYMNLPIAQSLAQSYTNPMFMCPSFRKGTNGNSSQKGLQIFRSGGRGGAVRSSKFGYFGHPVGGNSKFLDEVEDPTEEMVLFETDNYFIPFGNTSVNVRHGINSGMARRTTNYFDGHAKLKMHRLTRN